MNFHCNEACILCCMYVWKLFWGNPFHFCLSILLADVYSYLICLLHSNVNSSQYMSKWMTCIILIIMYYFVICFDRSWKDYFIHWNYWFFIHHKTLRARYFDYNWNFISKHVLQSLPNVVFVKYLQDMIINIILNSWK